MAMLVDEKEFMMWLDRLIKDNDFNQWAITHARLNSNIPTYLNEFLTQGWHGQMRWLAHTYMRRKQPKSMWPDARTALILGCNYAPDHNPLNTLEESHSANISVYARGRDYHKVLKGRLKQIATALHNRTNWQVKVFVDTAPLMEKPLAAQSGLGFVGKHTNLVSRDFGSWLFLGVILTDGVLPNQSVEKMHCGTCTACLDICPTQAFPAPYKLDARRCISYLTIEYDGHIDRAFRKPMGNRVFGCDDCLAVCPWNKFAKTSSDIKLSSSDALPSLAFCLRFDEDMFKSYFSARAVRRAGYIRFMRNVLIASGNANQPSLCKLIIPYLRHDDSRLRAMAVWALSCYFDKDVLATHYDPAELDDAVKSEWQQALSGVRQYA